MPKGLKRAGIAALVALALYALIGFLILPAVAVRVVNAKLAEYATVPAHLEKVRFNPFTLELELTGLRFGEIGGESLAFARLYANLQLNSLWSGALHLADVELEQPLVDLRFAKDGALNLAQLFKLPPAETATEAPADAEEGPFPVRIDRLAIASGKLHFEDLRPSEPIEFFYDSLDLDLANLSTLPDGNAEATLSASNPAGGRIDWQGQVSLAPIRSSGHLQVTDVALKTFWPYVRDAAPLDLEDGTASLDSRYELDLSQGTELRLSDASLKLAPFSIKAPDGRPLLKLASLDVAKVALDLARRQVEIGEVRSQGLEAWAAREADGQIDWQKLFAQNAAEPAPAAAVEAAPSAAEATEATEAQTPWQVLLQDAQLRGAKLHLADRQPKPAVTLEVGPLDLDVSAFDSLGTSPFQLKLNTAIAGQGRLQVEGQAQLQPTSAQLKVVSKDIDLRLAQAYLSPFIRLELRSGLLSSDLDVALTGTEPLALSVTGSADVAQLHTLDTLKGRDFVKWRALAIKGLDYRHGKSLSIDTVNLDQPYARVVINEDLTTNVKELLVPQPPSNEPDSPPLAIRIGAIGLKDGSANFADFSLRPNFATAIGQLNGKIGTLDNRSKKAAPVEIAGKVDRYAPVSIRGRLEAFDPLNSLDIATSFHNVELTTLTPYSGKFAGYRIRKGRLDLDLHYKVEQGRLNAENKLVLHQLELGERVDSKDAVDLPVRLAVALLKDTKGVISIELPVQGNLNDPQFSVMPIVWQTLRNLVLRAVQAPFKLIAGLVPGGGDNLDQVSFAPGSAELDDSAMRSLDTLADALKKRPELRLEVEGVSARASDGLPLAEQRLEREYRTVSYRMLQRRGDKVPASADELVVEDDDKPALLEGIYRDRLKQQPPAEWKELDREQRLAKMREAVVGSWVQRPTSLLSRKLAQDRAANIKDYLVQRGGLEDQRIYLLDVSLIQGEGNGPVPTTLHLDAE
ncbi:DUF748 domain-containing protein [Pseudomonas sp. PS02288]|uniref:DUF748 domain-containing protein n=1 Tax=Pseudomonas sp. PS02288 TaxID=2991443 RepID=UPI00249ADF4B|nr:DUF748 domain-containing protein [Pseudomonas sp. PS02288]